MRHDLDEFVVPITTGLTRTDDMGRLDREREAELDRRLIELAKARRRAWREICNWWPESTDERMHAMMSGTELARRWLAMAKELPATSERAQTLRLCARELLDEEERCEALVRVPAADQPG